MLPKVRLFKGGHHGSKTSSNECLLELIQPEICCVCCCSGSDEYTKNTDNQFPTQAFIDRIAKYTDKVYCTTLAKYEIWKDTNDVEYLHTVGFESMNGNIHVSYINNVLNVNCSNNNVILKDSEWFNTEFELNGVKRKMRTWPSDGV